MSTPVEFDVRVETASGDVAVVRVSGELDVATSPRVEDAIASAASAARVVVDLTDCTFLDSSGVRILMSAHKDRVAEGGAIELVTADERVLRVLEITNVDTVLRVHSSLDAAL